MTIEGKVKKQAKNYLMKNNWGKAIGGFLFLGLALLFIVYLYSLLVAFLPNEFSDFSGGNYIWLIVSFVICITVFIMALPLVSGYIKLCYEMTIGKDTDLSELFYYFKDFERYKKAFALNGKIALKLFTHLLGLLLPFITFFIAGNAFGEYYTLFNIIAYVFLFIGITIELLYGVRFFMVQIIMIQKENISVDEMFEIDKHCGFGNHGNYALLLLSFFPWILLCFFVVPMIFVMPYMTVSFANATKWMIKTFEERTKNI